MDCQPVVEGKARVVVAQIGGCRVPLQARDERRERAGEALQEPEHLLRFVMMEHLLPLEEVLGFLQSLAGALAAFVAGLERYTAAADPGDRHPRLALDHGLAVHRASLQWAERTIATLSAALTPSA